MDASSLWNEEQARLVYYAYGVDLIRTGGLLLRTTPSVIYRASVLFQRFEQSVDTHYRAYYYSPAEMRAGLWDRSGTHIAIKESAPLQDRCRDLYDSSSSSSSSRSSSSSTINSCRDEDDDDSSSDCANSRRIVPKQSSSARDKEHSLVEKVEFLVADHIGSEMRSGLAPLADLCAPLDYCVTHIIDQDDIVFLAAACVLVAAKMEDPGVRIRFIVNVFMRLGQRRLGLPVHEFLKPSPERYDDFKTCVTEAEEVLLHQLGFYTAVDCPHKHVLLYLALLVDGRVGPEIRSSAAAAAVTEGAKVGADISGDAVVDSRRNHAGHNNSSNNSNGINNDSNNDANKGRSTVNGFDTDKSMSRIVAHACPSRTVYTSEYIRWLGQAVRWINDAARCAALIQLPASALAVYALHWACPQTTTLRDSLSAYWTTLFGVSEQDFALVHRVYTHYIQSCRSSSSVQLAQLRSVVPRVEYRRHAEWLRAYKAAATAAAHNHQLKTEVAPTTTTNATQPVAAYVPSLRSTASCQRDGDTLHAQQIKDTAISADRKDEDDAADANSTMEASGSTMDAMEDAEAKKSRELAARVRQARDDLQMGGSYAIQPLALLPTMQADVESAPLSSTGALPVVSASAAVEEMQFEDLHDMQRRRRLEEAAEAERRRRERKASRLEEGEKATSHRHHHHHHRHHHDGRSSGLGESNGTRAAHTQLVQSVQPVQSGTNSRSSAKEDESRVRNANPIATSSNSLRNSNNRRQEKDEYNNHHHRSQRRRRSSTKSNSRSSSHRRIEDSLSPDNNSDKGSYDDRHTGRHRRHCSDRYGSYGRHSRRQSSRERHGSSRHGTNIGRRYDIHRPRHEEVRRR